MTHTIAKFLDHNLSEPWDILFKDWFERDSFFLPIIDTHPNYPVDIYESDTALNIELAVAGIDKENIIIEEVDGYLNIFYRKSKEDFNREEPKYLRKGIAKRAFNFSLKINDKFDLKKVEASMDKGLLKIEIPRTEEKAVIKKIIKIN